MSTPTPEGSGTEFFNGGSVARCSYCKKLFLYYTETTPHHCPKCKDVVQDRPSVVQSRECIGLYEGVEIASLPLSWEKFHTGVKGDFPSYRIDVKGREYGASWDGRIIIYASEPFAPGDVVDVRDMLAVHKVRAKYEEKGTVYGGTKTLRKEVPLNSEEGEEELVKRPYLVLERAKGNPTGCKLVWDVAKTKTTLKGFGRQYYAKVQDKSIKSWMIQGNTRSGRAPTEGVLAIVDDEHPLIVRGTGDIKYLRINGVSQDD